MTTEEPKTEESKTSATGEAKKNDEWLVAGVELLRGVVMMLNLSADESKAKNYVEVVVAGLAAPFDRAAVVLVRPGGLTPNELKDQVISCINICSNNGTLDKIDTSRLFGLLRRHGVDL